MKVFPMDSTLVTVGDIPQGSQFKTKSGEFFLKTDYLMTVASGSVNCVNLEKGSLQYYPNSHPVERVFLRAVEMQDED